MGSLAPICFEYLVCFIDCLVICHSLFTRILDFKRMYH